MNSDQSNDFFGKPISTYTDRDAVEDGNLVAVTRTDRVTNAVFNFLSEAAPDGSKPPNCWPVDMLGWFGAKNADSKALALANGLLTTNEREARRVYDENINGGIFKVFAVMNVSGNKLAALAETERGDCRTLWIMPNELDGLTLMFPSDY